MNKTEEKHPSYGLIGFSRISSNREKALFGTSIGHCNTIQMRVFRAKVERNLNRDWFFAEPHIPLIEVELSPTQFVDAITQMNIGDGHPCTITQIEGKSIQYPEFKSKRKQFEKEFNESKKDLGSSLSKAAIRAKELIMNKKPMNTQEKEELLNLIQHAERVVNDHMPFVAQSFNEQMDKTVNEAKGEVEAFFTAKIHQLGVESLKNELEHLKPALEIKQEETV